MGPAHAGVTGGVTGEGWVVTGRDGQLGRALAVLLPGAVLVDRPEFELADAPAVRDRLVALEPSVILHAGAWTAVDAAEADPEGARAVNVTGTAAVAAAAADAGALLVYVSTDYVFDGTSNRPYTEDDLTHPLSVYGATKLGGEQAARRAPRHLVVRTSWVFGEGKNFVRAILAASADRPAQPLAVVDDQRGRPTYAPDLAAGIVELVRRGATGVVHLQGGGEPGSWADVAAVALEAAGRPTPVVRTTTEAYNRGRPGPIAPRPANGVLDCTRAAASGVELRDWRMAVAAYVRLGP